MSAPKNRSAQAPGAGSRRPASARHDDPVRAAARRPVFWLCAAVFAALGGIVTTSVTAVVANWFDSARTADALATSPPVSVTTAYEYGGRYGWVTPSVLDQRAAAEYDAIDEATSGADDSATAPSSSDWMTSHGGVQLGRESVGVTLRGNRQDQVQLTRITPVLTRCGPTPTGTAVVSIPQGENSDASLEADFADAAPVFRQATDAATDQPTDDYFANHSISLDKNEQLTLKIAVTSRPGQTCQWALRASAVVDGSATTLLLGADQHWEVASGAQALSYRSVVIDSWWGTDLGVGAGPEGLEVIDGRRLCMVLTTIDYDRAGGPYLLDDC